MGDGDRPGSGGPGSSGDGRRAADTSPTDEFETAPFELVTEETRASILGTLAQHQAENPREPAMAFADLRAGAGVGADTTRGPEPLDAACEICGTGLTASYENGLLSVTCENDHRYPRDGLPPNAVVGRTLDEAVALQTRRTQHHCELVREGVCPACFDDVERDHEVLDESQASHVIVATCEGCGTISSAPIGTYLLREPAVVAFYHDHGLDVTETPLWALELPVVEPTVQSADPLRLSLSVERDGERLTLTVDEHAQLLDSERTDVD